MKADLRDRLRRLGVHKGTRQLQPVAPRRQDVFREGQEKQTASIEPALSTSSPAPALDTTSPLWNLELETDFGLAFVRRTMYPTNHQHGGQALAQALEHPSYLLARLGNGAPLDLQNAIFLDTETTGLAGGAGTLVFLVGVGYFSRQEMAFVVDQYFLREPMEETGMLCALDRFIGEHSGLVTFNGRGFDVPLLETRFTLSRLPSPFGEHAHLDLLMPARRAWRLDLGSCSLGSLEFHMLDVRRDQHDIPGFLIPQLYREYLATHNPAEMHRVMYHNLHDVLSMVTLVSRLCSALSAPRNPGEYLAAGLYYENAGQWAEAIDIYRAALARDVINLARPPQLSQRRILHRLAACLKHQQRNPEAVPYWRALGEAGDLEALIELAKFFEWDEIDLAQAMAYARQALALSRDPFTRGEINHRIERLSRKLNGTGVRVSRSRSG